MSSWSASRCSRTSASRSRSPASRSRHSAARSRCSAARSRCSAFWSSRSPCPAARNARSSSAAARSRLAACRSLRAASRSRRCASSSRSRAVPIAPHKRPRRLLSRGLRAYRASSTLLPRRSLRVYLARVSRLRDQLGSSSDRSQPGPLLWRPSPGPGGRVPRCLRGCHRSGSTVPGSDWGPAHQACGRPTRQPEPSPVFSTPGRRRLNPVRRRHRSLRRDCGFLDQWRSASTGGKSGMEVARRQLARQQQALALESAWQELA